MKRKITFYICLLLAAAFITGCSKNGEDFQPKSYTADGAQVKAIDIDVRDRKIEVSLSNDNQIHIDYYNSGKEYYKISVSDEKVLMMTAETSKGWTDYIGGKAAVDKRTISLQVPEALLTSLTLSTTNENISLPALTVSGQISLSTNGGDIQFERLDVGNTLNLQAKNGDIRGTVLGSYGDYSITCQIKKGESNLPSHLDGGAKTLHVSNNNGDIEIQFVSTPESLH